MSVVLFAALAVAQGTRAVLGWPVLINGHAVPTAASCAVGILAGAMAWWGWRTRA